MERKSVRKEKLNGIYLLYKIQDVSLKKDKYTL